MVIGVALKVGAEVAKVSAKVAKEGVSQGMKEMGKGIKDKIPDFSKSKDGIENTTKGIKDKIPDFSKSKDGIENTTKGIKDKIPDFSKKPQELDLPKKSEFPKPSQDTGIIHHEKVKDSFEKKEDNSKDDIKENDKKENNTDKNNTDKTQDDSNENDSIENKEKGGGAYKDLPSKEGTEKHHMPADSTSDTSFRDGPSIVMDKNDHRETASCGNSKEAQEYRAKQKQLIDEGKYKEAQQMDIDDIRDKFGDKYDNQISQMEEYTDKLLEKQQGA